VRDKRSELTAEPGRHAAKNRRAQARVEAMTRLRRMYPGMYARFYREEVAGRGGGAIREGRIVPAWEDVISLLVRAALDTDEAAAEKRVREGWASQREREVMRQVRRVREVLEQLTPVYGRDV
jgi:hypothetical protein